MQVKYLQGDGRDGTTRIKLVKTGTGDSDAIYIPSKPNGVASIYIGASSGQSYKIYYTLSTIKEIEDDTADWVLSNHGTTSGTLFDTIVGPCNAIYVENVGGGSTEINVLMK